MLSAYIFIQYKERVVYTFCNNNKKNITLVNIQTTLNTNRELKFLEINVITSSFSFHENWFILPQYLHLLCHKERKLKQNITYGNHFFLILFSIILQSKYHQSTYLLLTDASNYMHIRGSLANKVCQVCTWAHQQSEWVVLHVNQVWTWSYDFLSMQFFSCLVALTLQNKLHLRTNRPLIPIATSSTRILLRNPS